MLQRLILLVDGVMMFAKRKLSKVFVFFTVGMSMFRVLADSQRPELTTEQEYYQYGVLHKRDLGCAAEYKSRRPEKSLFSCLFSAELVRYYKCYKPSLTDDRYTNIGADKSMVIRVSVCLRNAAATGDVKVVQHLLKHHSVNWFGTSVLDTSSKLAAYYLASRNKHSAIAGIIYDKLIKSDDACRALINQGWSLEQERADFLAREKTA